MSSPDPATTRRWLLHRLVGSILASGAMIGGAAVLILTPLAWLGLGMFAAGFVGRLVLMVVNRVHRWKTRSSDLSVGGWWYNRKTRQVAESRVFRGIGWDGPYATPEDAARAREIARTRAAEWNAED